MTTLADLILATPDWDSLSSGALFSILSEKNIPYRDDTEWTWKGIASVVNQDTDERFGRHGCKLLQDAMKAAGEELWVSQISAGMPLTDPEIQGVLRYLDHVGAVPGARFVADAVLRQISVLEKHNIIATEAEIEDAKQSLLLEDRKRQLIATEALRWNRFCNAVDAWDGNPQTEPVL